MHALHTSQLLTVGVLKLLKSSLTKPARSSLRKTLQVQARQVIVLNLDLKVDFLLTPLKTVECTQYSDSGLLFSHDIRTLPSA